MALTFKINDGDIVVNRSTGRPKLIGNDIGENDTPKAKEKASQDLRGALSINRIRSGAGAGIVELVGIINEVGLASTRVLLHRQISNMFSHLIRLQRERSNIRPNNELFSKITLFRIVKSGLSKTIFQFRLDTVTEGGGTIVQSGSIQG